MDRCPVCNASSEEQRVCRRCKAPLGKIMDLEQDAIEHREKAVKAFKENRFHEMFFHAKRCRGIVNSPENSQLLATAAILIRRFDLAYFLWHQKTAQ
ncbi:hypothetical protein MTBBW1_940021 [Desulfamplus magnetovallimortis]|uniref:Uncharacterized protein n=1 Tax=Desulfamplus magnetovallimortis TaxID=1246637 RepID=A0A1W1HLG1_9BACT|nr:hypothetical protein [Desulfamplus magnetovallimortis]SLM33202.1 hypothetical protein MTBBW1_940021 [Desulfamplus magnetovallimortis]